MDVPFKVLLDYCFLSLPKTLHIESIDRLMKDLQDKSGYGKDTIKNYRSGKRAGYVDVSPSKNAYKCLFQVIWKRYLCITAENYKDSSIAFFRYLINSKLIMDYEQASGWIQRIQNEQLPDDGDDNAFFAFMENSQFFYTLYEYILLWKNQEFRDYDPTKQRSLQNVSVPHLIVIDDYPDYMTQSLIGAETNDPVLTTDLYERNCDFSFFESNKISLITGPGGQGKTLFLNVLRRIHYDQKDVFDDIIYIPLIALTLYEKLPDNATDDWIRTYITSNYPDVEIDCNEKAYLILLDGFNEYQAAKNQDAVKKITDDIRNLIKTISAPDNFSLSLVMTAREAKSITRVFGEIPCMRIMNISGTSDEMFKRIEDKCGKALLFDKAELNQLARIPLYALMLLNLPQESLMQITDKYSLMDQEYKWRSDQRLGSEQHMGAYDKRWYLYYYYVVLPYAAFYTVMSGNTYSLDRKRVTDVISDLNNGSFSSTLYESLCQRDYAGLEWEHPELNPEQLRHLMDNDEDKMVTYLDSSYRFGHEEWRDFLGAKYLHTVVSILHSHYTDKDFSDIMSLNMNFNVGANVARLFLQSFNLCSGSEKNKEVAIEFFKLDNYTKISSCLFGVIRFLHLAFDFNDYLQWDVPLGQNGENQTLQKIFTPLYRHLTTYDCAKKLKTNSRMKERLGEDGIDLIVLYVCEILSKVSEYYRRIYSFDKAYKVVMLAKQYDENSDIILQQEAKLYLCVLEWMLNGNSRPKGIDELQDMDEHDIYNTGIVILSKLAKKGFHLSGNTVGALKSTPAPVMIRYMNQSSKTFKPDYCGAFRCYLDVIYSAGYVRRDITYTVRQALNLLLKGYVRVSEDSLFDPEDEFADLEELKLEVCYPLFSLSVNQKSLELAKDLINKAEGQELAGLNYLRGVEKLWSGEKEIAKEYFQTRFKTESTLMSDIRLMYEYGENLTERINKGFRELIFGQYGVKAAGNGKIDKTHPAYWYIEARELELSLCSPKDAEQRKLFFAELESSRDELEIINMVYSAMLSESSGTKSQT